MSNKKLLSEAQVKRFMGLAGLKPLNEMSHYKMDDEKEPMMEEEEMEAEMPEAPEMEQEDAADVEIDEEDLAAVKEALDTLQDKLSPLLDQAAAGGEAELEIEDEEEAPEMDMGDEGEEDMDAELEDVDMEPTPEEEEAMQEQIVNEVARRVAKRIVEAKRAHQKMNEALGRKTVKGARPKLRRR